jgi:inhibitor of KinA sporulation pathway (predicted exonuclease)
VCETWVFKENIIPKLSVFKRKILRKVFGPTKKKDGSWKIKTNTEVDKLIQHRNIINYVKAQRQSWYRHIYRKPETSIVKKIYKWQPYTTRPVGRPKHRCDDDVRNGLRKMKLLKWTEQAEDRHEWKKIVEKAKTLHEL